MQSFTLGNIFLKTLHDNRAGVLGWGTGLSLMMFIGASQYPQVVGPLGPERKRNVEQVVQAMQAFSFMTGEVTAISTLGGFVTSRQFGILSLLLSLWAIVVGVGLIRWEEQAGPLEILLSTPHSRISTLVQKVLALLLSILALVTLSGAGLWLGSLVANETLPVDTAALAMLNVLPMVAFWGAAGLLAGQLTGTRRKASGTVGAFLFATYLLNNISNTVPSLDALGWLMPFRYFTQSTPLVPGGTMEWGGWLVLVAATVLALTLAAIFFARRDIGSAFPLFATRGAGQATQRESLFLLGSVFGKSLRDLIGASLAWGLALALYAAVVVCSTNEVLEPIREIARNGGLMGALVGEIASNEGFLAVALFINLPALLAIFSIIQAGNWASDEEEGRLEMLLAMPLPRPHALLARYAAILAGLLAILALTGAAIFLSAWAANVTLDAGRLVNSLLAIIPLAMLVAAFGLCVATWLPRPGMAVPVTITLVVVMFLLEIFAPLFRWPEAVLNLSIFHLYGRPLVEGIGWGGLSALTIATLLFGAASLVGLSRRDIAK